VNEVIRENQKYLNLLQIFSDILIVIISFGLSYYIRFYLMDDGIINLSFQTAAIPVIAMIPIYLMIYSTFDLYNSKRTKPISKEIYSIVLGNLLGLLLLIFVLFIFKLVHFSRYNLIIFFICNTTATIGLRVFTRYLLRKYRRKGYNLKHCLIVGTTHTAVHLIDKIKHHAFWGYNIVGLIRTDGRSSNVFSGYQILGDLTCLGEVLAKRYIDIVIIATDEISSEQLGAIIAKCEKAGVKTNIIPYYHKYVPANPYIDDLDGLPIIDTRHVPLDNVFKNFAKRLFDVAFAATAILLTSPILLFSAIMVKLTSKGPVLFKQERVGTNRQNFYMYKFRSMRMQTDEEELDKWTTKDDPRKTWWGSFIRKTSIDELPQFFNVLNGTMSVVGPRPERPYFVEKFKEEIPRYMIKHQVRPGITGWAQVNGYRGDTSIEARIEHDLYYIENWSLGLDVRIIFLTIFKGFVNKNAY
jgi:Undecaprenyl-phosphate glucose phosphotransferase